MLTKKQNLLETIHGGNPDRLVNQFEFMGIQGSPIASGGNRPVQGGPPVQDVWGVYRQWREGVINSFPVHTPEYVVIKDITHWRDYVKAPATKLDAALWEPSIARAEQIDRNEVFATNFVAPGIFEQCHHLGEITNTLMNLYDEPEAMHDLIDFLTDWEISQAEEICKYVKPEAIYHHDDWGTQLSSFMSVDMFDEFYTPAYEKIYGAYRENGVQLIIHHSDSYAANLVPSMIKMGVDIWQGCMDTNDVPGLVKKYGGQISFMGNINSAKVDYEGVTRETIREEVRKAIDAVGSKYYFIPNTTMGEPGSLFPGVYDAVTEEIAAYSAEIFDKL